MASEAILKIKEIIRRTDNVKSFRLELTEEALFQAGQFLIVSFPDNSALSKPLSFSSSPTQKQYIEFTKKITSSDFSKNLDKIQVGDYLKVKYPFGKFLLPKDFQKIVFICGGIGITPFRSMCEFIMDEKMDKDIVLLYANRSLKDIAFKDDFDIMRRRYSSFRVVHILSQPESDWQGRKGNIDSQLIKEEVLDYAQRKFYLCGPPLMVECMKKMIECELCVSQENIVTEDFKGY